MSYKSIQTIPESAFSPGQSCYNSSENLPKSCHGARFLLAPVCFCETLEVSLLTKEGRESVEKEHSPKGSRCSGRAVALAHKSGAMYASLQMWDAPPASAVPGTWNSAICQRLWRSHVVCWRCGW